MKTKKALKPTKAEGVFSGAMVLFLFFILLLWGATATTVLAIGTIGIFSYIFIYREHLRRLGYLTTVVCFAVATTVAAGIAVAVFR